MFHTDREGSIYRGAVVVTQFMVHVGLGLPYCTNAYKVR